MLGTSWYAQAGQAAMKAGLPEMECRLAMLAADMLETHLLSIGAVLEILTPNPDRQSPTDPARAVYCAPVIHALPHTSGAVMVSVGPSWKAGDARVAGGKACTFLVTVEAVQLYLAHQHCGEPCGPACVDHMPTQVPETVLS
jgi:hypothetical protein